MSDGNLQENTEKLDSFQELLQQGAKESQALVLSAFIEERKRWQDKRASLQKEFDRKMRDYKKAQEAKNKESKLKQKIYNKILRRPSPAEKELNTKTESLDNIAREMLKNDEKQPDPILYQFASLGNDLFKSR